MEPLKGQEKITDNLEYNIQQKQPSKIKVEEKILGRLQNAPGICQFRQ